MQVESIAECSKHSAKLLTCIKRQSVLKTIFGLPFEWPLKTGFTVFVSSWHDQAFSVSIFVDEASG